MSRKPTALFLVAVVAAVATLSVVTGQAGVAAQGTVYTVTIENLTRGQPFTPPLLAVHSSGMDLFTVGQTASSELQQIAENGNLDPMVAKLRASAAVSQLVVGDAPVLPGRSVTLSIEAPAGSSLSWVSMLICTNDGFTGIDSMPLSGVTTVSTNAYDAGTERNTQDFADMVPPCQALVGVSSSDAGTGMTNPALREDGVIAHHPGVIAGNDLTASHRWTDPVARVTISTSGSMVSPPSTGSGGLVESQPGAWYWGAAAALVALSALVGVAFAARRQVQER